MRISYNWLRRYIDLDHSPEELSQVLTSIGLEVESIDYLGKEFDGFFVGEVVNVQKHPNADRLKLCTVRVSTKEEPLQIVCGAPNVQTGQKVIVGKIGAVVPHNQHDPAGKPFELVKATIRGVDSFGMICSEKELGIGDDSNGIKVLESNVSVGIALKEYLGMNDVAFEIGITPNRPDCLSHIGVARDIAAVLGKKYQHPKIKLTEKKKSSISAIASVKLENADDCPRYCVRVIQNVHIKQSPDWLKQLLTAAGIRPINNVVDVTNFVMLEYGQPMHAFDYDNLADHTIIVKSSAKGSKFTTLDGKTHTLTGSEVMICDGEKAVAIGGVMGGLNSEISESTSTVLLEAAYFSPVSVRKTAKRLGINTDASYRFERGVDPNITELASQRAAVLIAELSGGGILKGRIDAYPKKIAEKKIAVRFQRVNSILGTALSASEMKKILLSLEMKVSAGKDKKSLICSVPTFRPDIELEIDLIEEIARLHGYDNIENKISSEVMFSKPDTVEIRIREIRSWCEANGLNEILTNSLIDTTTAKIFSDNLISVQNPLSVELETLRPSLLSTMLQSVAFNYNHGASRVQVFEIGTVFSSVSEKKSSTFIDGYNERNVIGICLSGQSHMLSWHEKQRDVDFFDLKGLVLSLLKGIGLDNSDLIYYNAPSSLTEMTIGVEINNTYAGSIGKVKSETLKKYRINQDVFFAELDLESISKIDPTKIYRQFSKFPTVTRDVAFIVDKSAAVNEIERAIKSSGGLLITAVTLFDLFEGKTVGDGKKSVAFSLNINSSEKTLTDGEIDVVIDNVVRSVTKTFEATLRSM